MSTLLSEESGATMVEYALLVAMIAIACIVVVGQFGLDAQGMFAGISEALPDRQGSTALGL